MIAILDTNVLVSALLFRRSTAARFLASWRDGRFILATAEAQLDELRRVTRYAKLASRISSSSAGTLVNRLRDMALVLGKLPQVDISPDPADNYLLALAEAASADFLVTGDKADLLALDRHGATRIVSVMQFAGLLRL